jgi:WD40-like Beta Propeller Repeat
MNEIEDQIHRYVAAVTRSERPVALAEVIDRQSRRNRARLLTGVAAALCAVALAVAGFVLITNRGSKHALIAIAPTTPAPSQTPTTQAPNPALTTGLKRVALPGGYTGYVPAVGPIAISPDGRTAYISPTHDGVVTPIDLRNGRAQRPISVGGLVQAIAITPNGRTAFVVEGGIADTVVPVDLATRTVGPAIHVVGPRGLGSAIAITRDGHMAYVSSLSENGTRPTGPGQATTTQTTPSYVVPIDLQTNTALRPISLAPLPDGGHIVSSDAPPCETNCGFDETIGGITITPNGSTAYVSDTELPTGGLFAINLSTGHVGPKINIGGGTAGPVAVSPDGRTAYVAGDGTVTPVDLASHAAQPSIRVPPVELFSAMTITPDGQTLVAVGYPSIGLLNLASREAETPIRNPSGGTDIAITSAATSAVLPPATTPSVVSECSLPIHIGNDATITPTLCDNGGINVTAWDYYAKIYPRFMGLGKSVSESTVLTLMCAEQKSLPTMEQTSQLTARYYGWSFAASPAFEQWPFYPKPSGNECP